MPQATKKTSARARVAPVSSGYADVNGIKLYHEIYGQGEPLVVLHGGLMTKQGIRYGFRAACRKAGIREDWQPRELRHTAISLLSRGGVPIEAISDLAGHANPGVTQTVYRHVLGDQIATAADFWDKQQEAGEAIS